jgi:LacI family transcriptional regulator
MITGRPDLQSAQQREAGFRRAMADAGIGVDEDLVRLGAFDPLVSAQAARELLLRPDRPSAIFAANDLSAIATIQVARELGLRVPDDLSVVGFDNVPEAALSEPPLTTVEQPIRQMGHTAMKLLVRLVRERPTGAAPHLNLPTRLVARSSTAIHRVSSQIPA